MKTISQWKWWIGSISGGSIRFRFSSSFWTHLIMKWKLNVTFWLPQYFEKWFILCSAILKAYLDLHCVLACQVYTYFPCFLLVGFLFLVAIHHTICQIKITNCFTMINNNNIKTVKTLIRYSLQILGKCNTSNQENNINIYWLICLWCNYSGFVNYFVFCIVFVMTTTPGSQLRSES